MALLCPRSPGDDSGTVAVSTVLSPQKRGAQTRSYIISFCMLHSCSFLWEWCQIAHIPSFYCVLNRFLYFPESHQILLMLCDQHCSVWASQREYVVRILDTSSFHLYTLHHLAGHFHTPVSCNRSPSWDDAVHLDYYRLYDYLEVFPPKIYLLLLWCFTSYFRSFVLWIIFLWISTQFSLILTKIFNILLFPAFQSITKH